ncbi:MAG TPA: hypothetical protein VND93_06470 [Myxococcales bacterium]|nr:hypothetical protein [Myxococcales bacterium]
MRAFRAGAGAWAAGAVWLLVLAGCGRRDLTVRTLSEYGQSPIASILLQADDGEWVFTDDQGEAVLHDVGTPFTVRVHQHVIGQFPEQSGGWANDDVWVLQSPEGDPLVLLVDGNFVTRDYASVTGSLSGTSGGPFRVFASNGTSDRMPYSVYGAGTQFDLGFQWEGVGRPLDTTFRAFETDSTVLPGHYAAYGEYSARLEPGAALNDFTIPLQPVNEATVTAAPTVPGGLGANVQLELSASLQVEGGGGVMWLGAITSGPSLSAVFPQVSGTVPWMGITARDMGTFDGAQSWDRHAVSPPETGVPFDLPPAVALVDPAEGATINQDTVFRWRGGPAGGQTTFHLICNWSDAAGVTRQVNFRTVEGSGTEARLPAIPNLDLAGASSCRWSVGWAPAGTHEGALLSERGASQYRGSRSQSRSAVFK